jgi:hypothetical protein
MIKKCIGYSIVILHELPIILTLFCIILILFNFKINKIISYYIVVFTTLVIIGWCIFGNCILTPLENYLLSHDEKYDDGTQRSHITIIIEKCFNISQNQIYYFCTYLQVFVIAFFLWYILFTK